MLKIFSDRCYLSSGTPHYPLFYPFWGSVPGVMHPPDAEMFQDYAREAPAFLRMTSLEEADVAVMPGQWDLNGTNVDGRRLAEAARKAGKPLFIFCHTDFYDTPIDVRGSVIFSTSLRRSKQTPHEFAVPGFNTDFLNHYFRDRLPLRPKQERPIVSFCGHSSSGRATRFKRLWAPLKRSERFAPVIAKWEMALHNAFGVGVRRHALRTLSQSRLVTANFIIRDAFFNGCVQHGHLTSLELATRSRDEYVQNMVDSDYVLCVRGVGNFSIRFYEALSCGRIPIFVNTDCVLPFEEWIDWRKHCVWIEEKDIPQIAERVAAFHAAISPSEFETLQKANRTLWEDWVSPCGFFQNMHRYLPVVPCAAS